MGLFSIFKTPVNETLGIICDAYHHKLKVTGDSKQAFVDMANEAFNQLRKHKRSNFSSAVDTYRMLGSREFTNLGVDHEGNRESLENYLYNMMIYIRSDYYQSGGDYHQGQRLKVMIQSNLG